MPPCSDGVVCILLSSYLLRTNPHTLCLAWKEVNCFKESRIEPMVPLQKEARSNYQNIEDNVKHFNL